MLFTFAKGLLAELGVEYGRNIWEWIVEFNFRKSFGKCIKLNSGNWNQAGPPLAHQFRVNFASHSGQLNLLFGVNGSCFWSECWFSAPLDLNFDLHISQIWDFSPLCILRWPDKVHCLLNLEGHSGHWKFFSFLWTSFWCCCNSALQEKIFPHSVHPTFFSSFSKTFCEHFLSIEFISSFEFGIFRCFFLTWFW